MNGPAAAPAHDHGGGAAMPAHERRTWAVALLAAAAAAVELYGGWRTGSAALLAESVHMGAHVGAFVLAGLAYVVARRLRAQGRTRAAARAPDAAAVINGLLLLALGAALALESLRTFAGGRVVEFRPAMEIAVFGLVVNVVSAALLHHDHGREAGHGRDVNFRAVYLHVIGDGAVALLAIGGLAAGRIMGWRWTDPVAGGLGAVLVISLGAQITSTGLGYLTRGRSAGPAIAK